AKPATDETIWLLFSQTKMITAAALWQLVDQGAISFADRVSDHIPEFARNGKAEITVYQLLTHRGGFPNARPGPEGWADHAKRREAACDFTLEWWRGSKIISHGASAHWVAAVLIETLTGRDYRDVIREELLEPIGLANDIFVGVPAEQQVRCAVMYELRD